MTADGEVRLSYLEPDGHECGMQLQLLELDHHQVPFKSSRFTVEPGGVSPPDQHSVAEMWIIIQGGGELLFDGQPIDVTAGDAVYFRPFRSHQIRNKSNQSLIVLSFWWPING